MRKMSRPTWQFLEQVGRLGWDHREVSKLRAEPECKFVEQNAKVRHDEMQILAGYIETHSTLETVSAGDHCDLSMSRQIAPLLKEIINKCENVV